MKAISRYVAMCAIALSGLAITSCTEESENAMTAAKVVLDYKIGDATTETRAEGQTELGSDDLNENKIESLILLGFDKDGKQLFEPEEINPSGSTTSAGYHHKDITGSKMTVNMANTTDNKFYLVANCQKAKDYKSLSDLQAATISDTNFKGDQKQKAFVMDATDTKVISDEAENTIHFQFNLRRALAKIRLEIRSNVDINASNIQCKLVQYTADGNIIAGDKAEETAGETTVKSTELSNPTCTQDAKYVFYSYANNWVDTNKKPNLEEPINEKRQTYILLKAPFKYTNPYTNKEVTKDYFYKVPVNKRLPDNNDEIVTDPWAVWKKLYRLDRNTIYDITVNVDRPGGTDEDDAAVLTVTPTIQEWQDGGTYDYIDASTDVVIPGGEQTEWGYKVYYGFPKRGPMITLKDIDTKGKPWILQTDNPMFGFVECDEDGNYDEKEPVYDTNISQNNNGNNVIGHTYKIEDFIINQNGEKKTLQFYVVPKNRLDLAKPHNVKAQVFLTKYPNDKFVLNPGFKYKGCEEGKFAGKDIHFEQVL